MELKQFEDYHQTAFEDILSMHLLIQNPEEFYKLYFKLHVMFEESGHGENSQFLAMTLMAFPYKGKNTLTEDETVQAVSEIQTKLLYGFPILN